MNQQRLRQNGFTLIELVVAISILAIMMGMAYTALSNLTKAKIALDDTRETRIAAGAILERITRELQLAFNQVSILPPRDRPNEVVPQKVSLTGQSESLDGGGTADTITFVALEGGQYVPDGSSHVGLVQITYRLASDPEAPMNQGPSQERQYLLIREETPILRPAEKAYEKIMVFPIANNVTELKFRYYNSKEDAWVDSWGKEGAPDGLPKMVKFGLSVRSPNGRIEKYSTLIALRSRE